MAREIETQQTGLIGSTLYATLDSGGLRWDGTAFEPVTLADWASYAVALAEADGTGHFTADQPAGIPAGTPLAVTVYRRAGGSPAATDPVVGSGSIGVDVTSIAGSTLAATNLREDEIHDPPTIPTASDNAAAVWGTTTRTLSAFGFMVTLADASVTSAKFTIGTVNAAAAGVLERLMLLVGRWFPAAGGSVTLPKSGNGNLVVKGSGGATISTQAVGDDGTNQSLGAAS